MKLIEIQKLKSKLNDCITTLTEMEVSINGNRYSVPNAYEAEQLEMYINIVNSEYNKIKSNRYDIEYGLKELTKIVCSIANLEETEIKVKTRKREIVQARQIIMSVYFKTFKNVTLAMAAEPFGMDHASTSHAIITVRNLRETDSQFNDEYQDVWNWATDINPKFCLTND